MLWEIFISHNMWVTPSRHCIKKDILSFLFNLLLFITLNSWGRFCVPFFIQFYQQTLINNI